MARERGVGLPDGLPRSCARSPPSYGCGRDTRSRLRPCCRFLALRRSGPALTPSSRRESRSRRGKRGGDRSGSQRGARETGFTSRRNTRIRLHPGATGSQGTAGPSGTASRRVHAESAAAQIGPRVAPLVRRHLVFEEEREPGVVGRRLLVEVQVRDAAIPARTHDIFHLVLGCAINDVLRFRRGRADRPPRRLGRIEHHARVPAPPTGVTARYLLIEIDVILLLESLGLRGRVQRRTVVEEDAVDIPAVVLNQSSTLVGAGGRGTGSPPLSTYQVSREANWVSTLSQDELVVRVSAQPVELRTRAAHVPG